MKRFVERAPRGARPGRGFLAPCICCGLVVVHARSTGAPFHMHRWSKRCRQLAERRSLPLPLPES